MGDGMKRIGLIDVDGHNYPNLPLMKISAWHKKQGEEAAETYGVNSTNISRACRNSKRTAKGCRWQYAK